MRRGGISNSHKAYTNKQTNFRKTRKTRTNCYIRNATIERARYQVSALLAG
jgi:hypothetical protein